MKEIYRGLWIGDDSDVDKAREKNWAIVHACKNGDHSHRSLLNYDSAAAPHNSEYLTAKRGKELYLNMVDSDSDKFIPTEMVDEAIKFIREHLEKSEHVLVHCNRGESRSAGIGLLTLYELGKLPKNRAISTFKKLYSKYAPSKGVESFIRKRVSI